MALYFFVLSFIAFLAICNSITKNKYNTLFYIIAVFLLFFFMAFRDQSIGTDLKTYLPLFERVKNSRLIDICGVNIEFVGYEQGYLLLNYLVSLIGNSRFLLVVVAGLYIGSVSYIIHKYSPLPFISLLVFVLANFYFSGMNLLRQYIAIAVLLFSLKYVIDRNFFKFIVTLLIATSMHRTALVFSLLYFLYPIQITKRYFAIVLSVSLVSYFFLGQYLIPYVLNFMELSKFEKYILAGADGGTIFYVFILFFVCLGTFVPVSKRNNPLKRIFFHMMYLALLIQSFAVTVAELARLTQFFFIGFIVYLPCLISYCRRPNVRLIFMISSIVLMLAYFVVTSQNNTDSVIPYKFMH